MIPKLNLTLKVKVNHPPNNRDLNQGLLHLWSTFGDPSLNGWWVIARTSYRGWRTHTGTNTHTDRRRQRQYPKAKTGLGWKGDPEWNVWISFSLKLVPKVRINNSPISVQIMAWRRKGDKPLSEPVMFRVLTHIFLSIIFIYIYIYICVPLPDWVKET